MTAYLLKPYDKDGTITAATLLGRPSGSAAKVEGLLDLSRPDTDYDMIMRKQAERKNHG